MPRGFRPLTVALQKGGCNFSVSSGVWLRVKLSIKNFIPAALTLVITLFVGVVAANAQTIAKPETSDRSTSTLIKATQDYKASSAQLLALQQSEVTKATAKLEDLKKLVSEGLIARVTLEEEEQKLASLRAQLQATQKQITDSDNMIAEITAEKELAKKSAATSVKLVAKPYGASGSAATMLRYNGFAGWSLASIGNVQSFFSARFGHALPTSAIGQSATHNRLGYDHRNAVDVALHPDSAEGQALINYLQQRGIPFLAFRGAIPGVATGPHIHIGNPSHRLS